MTVHVAVNIIYDFEKSNIFEYALGRGSLKRVLSVRFHKCR